MQFKRIEIQGFKSFAEKYELLFHDGLTGIVGPNGCGKSNIIDAIRWVMGESSARKMRGAEMDDVIFSGTGKRAKRNFAQVSLVLSNDSGAMPEKYDGEEELIITRRIERGSGSSYRINGAEVRARDVQLLFADLSLGAGSAAQVSQGQVAELIAQRPVERRHLLEEAAGIRGLRVRRHESELKLKQTQDNLLRVDDMLGLLRKQYDELTEAAAKAKQYRTLSSRIRQLQGMRLYTEHRSARAALSKQQNQIDKAETETAKHHDKQNKLTNLLATQKTETGRIQETLTDAQGEKRRQEIALEHFDQSSAERQKQQQARQERAQDIDGELTQLQQKQSEIVAKCEDFAKQIAALESEEAEPHSRREALQARQTELQTQSQQIRQQMDALTAQNAQRQAETQALQTQQSETVQKHQRIQSDDDRLKAEQAVLQEAQQHSPPHQQMAEDIAQMRLRLQEAQARSRKLDTVSLPAAEQALTDAREQHTQTQQQNRQALEPPQDELTGLSAQIDALSALFQTSGKDFPKLLDNIQAAEGFETALGAVLADDLQASADPQAPISWQIVTPAAAAPALPEGVRSLSEFVKVPQALSLRLSQIGVVFTIDEAERALGNIKQGQRLVSREGDVWRWDGLRVRAHADTPAARRLAERNRLAQLVTQRGELEERLALIRREHADALKRSEAALQESEAAYQTLRTQSREQTAECTAMQTQLHELEKTYAQNQQKYEQQQDKLQDISRRREALAQELEMLDRQAAEIAQKLTASQAQHNLPDDEIQVLMQQLETLDAQIQKNNLELAQFHNQHEMRRQKLDNLQHSRQAWQENLDSNRSQSARLERERDMLKQQITQNDISPEGENRKRQQILDALAEAERHIDTQRQALAKAENAMRETQNQIDSLVEAIRKCQENAIRADEAQKLTRANVSDIESRIAQEFSCTADDLPAAAGFDAEGKIADSADLNEELRTRMTEREAMGEVNLRAESEQHEVEAELGELTAQSDDLREAVAELEKGIKHLNSEAEKHLLAAFTEINRHFASLFTELFGGGKALIRWEDPAQPLDSGVEILASPPGKRLNHLSLLSGGEQALTALALILAMFMVKPLPICILDEVDAALDDDNVRRLCDLIEKMIAQTRTRFLLVTHHRMSMSRCDTLYGVTMAEKGVSQMVSVEMESALHDSQAA